MAASSAHIYNIPNTGDLMRQITSISVPTWPGPPANQKEGCSFVRPLVVIRGTAGLNSS